MPIVRDQAVALRRYDYSETSQVLVLMTRAYGKVRTIAKGIKRSTRARFAAGIDLLEVGHVVFSLRPDRPENLATLTEWKQTRPMTGLRQRLDRIRAAEYAAEITAMLTEDGDPHPRLFDALVSALEALCGSSDVIEPVLAFQRTLLEETGLWPRFDACVLCARTGDLTYFSALEGGMICRHCEPTQVEKRAVSAGVLGLLSAGQSGAHPPDSLGASILLNYHIAHLAGYPPQMGVILERQGPARA